MKTIISLSINRPMCPACYRGSMIIHSVSMDTTPEIEPSLSVKYACSKCPLEMEIDDDDVSKYGYSVLTTAAIKKIHTDRLKRGGRW